MLPVLSDGEERPSPMSARAGVDLGGTKIQTVIIDDQHAVTGQTRVPTPKQGGPQAVADAIVATIRDACGRAGIEPSALAGIGVGSPGTIDDAAGTVTQAFNVSPDWEGSFPLAGAIGAELGCATVRLGNDVTVGTEAEFQLGAGREFQSLLGVFWGTGVGSGIILRGQPWFGRGSAGEFGHMVVKLGGATCTCGRIGCIEAYAGRKSMELRAQALKEDGRNTKLFKIMKQKGRENLSSGVWAKALEDEDKLAIELIERALEALSAGIASAVNLLDVEAVVIGGGLGTRLGEPYVAKIRERMLPHLFVDKHPPVVRLAALGDLGGAIGAALQVPSGGAITPGLVSAMAPPS
jgi:glucokinase